MLLTLDASKRQLETINVSAFVGLFFTRLILSNNFLTHIEPGTFFCNKYDDVTHRNSSGFEDTCLTILEIADNRITRLQFNVFDGLSLDLLDLHGNQLTSLFPPSFHSIHTLDVSGNSLTNLWPVDKNNITTIEPKHFSGYVESPITLPG